VPETILEEDSCNNSSQSPKNLGADFTASPGAIEGMNEEVKGDESVQEVPLMRNYLKELARAKTNDPSKMELLDNPHIDL
jgi:predicted transcriptional regulator with HTH domain